MPARCCVCRWRRSARLWAGMLFSSLHATCFPMSFSGIFSRWPGPATDTLSSVSAPHCSFYYFCKPQPIKQCITLLLIVSAAGAPQQRLMCQKVQQHYCAVFFCHRDFCLAQLKLTHLNSTKCHMLTFSNPHRSLVTSESLGVKTC